MVAFDMEVESFCKSIGFNNKQVEKIRTVLKTESDLSRFKLFIIENDGAFRSNLELIFTYIKTVELEETYPVDAFISDYLNKSRVEALTGISRGLYNDNVLHKVENLLSNGFTLKCIYNQVVSKNVNIFQSLNFLEEKC